MHGDMATIGERYFQLDMALESGTAVLLPAGLTLIARQGGRARYLADMEVLAPGWEGAVPGEILEKKPMALEELYLALEGAVPAREVAA